MSCWSVPLIGDGTDENPYRPDLPAGIDWSAVYIEPPDPVCVIRTDADLSAWPVATPASCDPPPSPDPDI